MDNFTFGMYKGKDIDTIIKINPKYVLWAEQNVSYFSLTQEQHNACVSNIKQKPSYFDRMETEKELGAMIMMILMVILLIMRMI